MLASLRDGDQDAPATLLQQAGWELTDTQTRFRNGELLELRLVYAEGASLAEQALAQGLVVALSQVGVRVRADVEDPGELFSTRTTGDFDLVIAFDAVNADPAAAVYRFGSQWCPATFGVEGCTSSISTNLTGVRDDELDGLLDAAESETDQIRRLELFTAVPCSAHAPGTVSQDRPTTTLAAEETDSFGYPQTSATINDGP